MIPERIAIVGFREPHTKHRLIPVRFVGSNTSRMSSEWAVRVHQYQRGGK